MGPVITGCSFTGVHWDAKATETVQTVAKALLNLTELFRAQHIQIDSMVKFEAPANPVPPAEPKKRAKRKK